MSFLSLMGVEFKKIRRSKIFWILLIPVIMMWVPSIINADMNFDLRGIPITPENNFFIQGFMGMVWFMIPASLVICTVLISQTERSNRGILKMLSLPIPRSQTVFCEIYRFADAGGSPDGHVHRSLLYLRGDRYQDAGL